MAIRNDITLRAIIGRPLTWQEGDNNWSLLLANDLYLNTQVVQAQQAAQAAQQAADQAKGVADQGLALAQQNSDALPNKVDKVAGKGLSTNDFTTDQQNKLDNLPTAQDLTTTFAGKVDKVEGKGLSTNDLTDALYEKLQSIDGSRWQGVFTSLANLQNDIPVGQPGWYAWVDAGVGEPVQMAIWDTNDAIWRIGQGSAGQLTPAQVLEYLLENPDVHVLTDDEYALLVSLSGVEPGAQVNDPLVDQATAEAGASNTRVGWSVLRVWQAAQAWWNASPMKTKLDGVQAEAQKNPVAATQAEAQAGTVEELRSWSVLRVWQAIQAWWNASAMKTKLDAFPSMPPADGKTYALKDGQWVESAGGGGGNLFDVQFYTGLRANLATERPGFAFLDGQKTLRSMWPDAFARITNYPIATEAAWAAGDKGKFTLGDGSTDFRLADWNGATGGKARVLRGGVAGTEGTFEEDQIQNITGTLDIGIGNNSARLRVPAGSGVFRTNRVSGSQLVNTTTYSSADYTGSIDFDASLVARAGDETRAASVKGAWIVRLSNAAGPVGQVDVQALASEVAALPSKVPVLIKETVYSTPGAITHVMDNMTAVYEVEVWGAGAPGGGRSTTTPGGTTSFGSVQATGGGIQITAGDGMSGEPGIGIGGDVNLAGQSGQQAPASFPGMGGAAPMGSGTSVRSQSPVMFGVGGIANGNNLGGASGGYAKKRLAVVGGTSVSGVVGAAGTTTGGGLQGGHGRIVVHEYSSNLPGVDVVNQLINEMAAARPTRVAYSGAASPVALGVIPANANKVTVILSDITYTASTNLMLEMDDGQGNWLGAGTSGTMTRWNASGVGGVSWNAAMNMLNSGITAGSYTGKIVLEKNIQNEWVATMTFGGKTAVWSFLSNGVLPGNQATARSLRIVSSGALSLTATVKVEK